jgi:hypothetical protein
MIKPTILECLVAAANSPNLVSEFDRLTGNNLSRKGSPLDLAIDDASGRTDTGISDFIRFVDDCIYQRI